MLPQKILRFCRLVLLLSPLGLFFFSAQPANAALIPEPLPQINTSFVNVTSYAEGIHPPILYDGTYYLVVNTAPYGAELYRTDGSAGGTTLVRDLFPGKNSGVLGDLTVVGDGLYFLGNDGTGASNGAGVWRYDSRGFHKTDLALDPFQAAPEVAAVGDALYVAAEVDGDNELWRVVGTTATKIDLAANASSTPGALTAVGDGLYLSADVDQPEAGTHLIYVNGTSPTIVDFGDAGALIPAGLMAGPQNILYALGLKPQQNGTSTITLWKVTATTPNPPTATQINIAAAEGAEPSLLATTANGGGESLYFMVDTAGAKALWRYDGTSATPIHIKDDNLHVTQPRAVNGALYFVNDVKELWRVEGITATQVNIDGTNEQISELQISQLTAVSATLYLFLEQPESTELWKVVGMAPAKIETFLAGNFDREFGLIPFGDDLWVRARINSMGEPFYSTPKIGYFAYDGTTLSKLDLPFGTSSTPGEYAAVGSDLYFSAFDGSDFELWHALGNTLTKIELFPGSGSSYPRSLTTVGNALYLIAMDGSDGANDSLWQVIGNTPIKIDLNPGGDLALPHALVAVESALYVQASESVNSVLYRVEGTNVTKIPLAGAQGVNHLTAVETALYLVASANSGNELWRVIGTTPTHIDLPQDSTSSLESLASIGDTLYFMATGPASGAKLWQVQGMTPTQLSTYGGVPYTAELIAAESVLYLLDQGLCGSENPDIPAHLWRYQEERITEVEFITGDDIEQFFCPQSATAVGDSLYLNASVNNERELWQVAGRSASKVDIYPGAASSDPADLMAMGDTLFLSAFDGMDRELWRVRGPIASKTDVFTGNGSGEIGNMFTTGSQLYFSAWGDLASGAELWTVRVEDSTLFLPGVLRRRSVGTSLPIERLLQGGGGRVLEQEYEITFIGSYEQWESVAAQLQAWTPWGNLSQIKVEIDKVIAQTNFQTHAILLAWRTIKPDSGYGFRIDRVT